MYPSEVITRRRKERAEAFSLNHRNYVRDLQSKISAGSLLILPLPYSLLFQFDHPLPLLLCFLSSPPSGNSDENVILLKEVTDIFDAKASDPGDLLDVITWYDGTTWWAVVALEGKMRETKRIKSFKVCGGGRDFLGRKRGVFFFFFRIGFELPSPPFSFLFLLGRERICDCI